MSHYLVELILWVLLAFFVGCIIGCLLRKLMAPRESKKTADAPVAGERKTEKASEPLAAAGKPVRPSGIAAARGGKPDNLQRISGIGPKNEKTLHGLGFFHFNQIAAWTAEEAAWVDDHLRFNGRIAREEWIGQARLLAEGKDEEFKKLYGSGGLKNRKGERENGSRTRKT